MADTHIVHFTGALPHSCHYCLNDQGGCCLISKPAIHEEDGRRTCFDYRFALSKIMRAIGRHE